MTTPQEVTASNDTRPSLPTSEVGGSSEEADDDNENEGDGDEEDDGTDNDQEDGEDEEDEEEEEGGDETSAEVDDDDEYEDELRAAVDKVKPTQLSQPSDGLSSELLRLNGDKEVRVSNWISCTALWEFIVCTPVYLQILQLKKTNSSM